MRRTRFLFAFLSKKLSEKWMKSWRKNHSALGVKSRDTPARKVAHSWSCVAVLWQLRGLCKRDYSLSLHAKPAIIPGSLKIGRKSPQTIFRRP
jgi:hypothetical protein